MTGLCGWIAPGSEWSGDALARMVARLPEPRGKIIPVTAGRAALAAPEGQLLQDGRLVAGYTGRLRWRDSGLEDLARERGGASALLEAWRRHGPNLLNHVRGHFSLAVLDGESGKGVVATDRMSSHPVAYATVGAATAFSTSVQPLRVLSGVDGSIPPQAVLAFLFFYVMPAPQSIYAGVRKLRPMERLSLSASGCDVAAYRRAIYAQHTERDVEELAAMLRERLQAGVEWAMEGLSESQTGAFLSGGLDSSTVTAFMAKRSAGRVKTFTVGFDEPEYDESGYARIVADAFGTDHHELRVTPKDVEDLMPRLAPVYDEPFGNTSAVPVYYCARAAKEAGIETMLAGDGGDELFAGNERYQTLMRYDWYGRLPAVLRKGLIEPASRMPGFQHLPLGRKVRGLVRYANTPLPDRVYAFDFFYKEPIENLFDSEQLRHVDLEEAFNLVRTGYQAPEQGSRVQRLMHMDAGITLADNDLRKVNRMTALAGVDVRYPMLDDDLIDFAAQIPEEVLLLNGELRGFYKHGMTGVLPREVLEKSKHGFGLPFGRWIKHDVRLKEMVDDALQKFKNRDIVLRGFVDRVMQAHHCEEPTIVDRFAWDIAILEMWLQHWEDGGMTPDPEPSGTR